MNRSPASLEVSPGRFDTAYRRELEQLASAQAIEKIWSKKAALWGADEHHAKVIANRLGWIPVLDEMEKGAAGLAEFSHSVSEAGLRDVVLLGMGGSSLAPEVFSLTFPAPASGRRFFVLDSTDPGSIRAVEGEIDLAKTLFIVASKSGKTIETLSQFFYFHNRLHTAGLRPPGDRFIAITDEGSYLARLAGEYSFRRTFVNRGDIGGRYSALSFFGLVPAALWGVNLPALLHSAIAMRERCGPAGDAQTNPALALGTLLGVAAEEESNKLVLLSTPRLVPLGNWIEQLIAESTGKEMKGIVPVAGGAAPIPEVLAEGCVVAALSLAGEDASGLDATLEPLRAQGVPAIRIRLERPEDLGGEFFKWKAATAVAGAVLGIDPFDEPNVQESKDNTARILERFQSSGQMPAGTAALGEGGIELFADGNMRHSISTLNLSESLRTFFALRKPGDYLAVLAYLDRNPANLEALGALRDTLSQRLNLPVLLGFGPRYMHSIGQLYKGGPPTGLFLVLTSAKAEDLSIPGAKYSFGQLQMAQALGDMESLGRRRKPALRLHLTQGEADGLVALKKYIHQALASIRSAGR